MLLTVKIKLLSTAEDRRKLLNTMHAFNAACNHVSAVAWETKTFGKVGLQKICYYDIRDKFSLSAQMAVRVMGKVSESYKVNKKNQHSFKKEGAIVYDQRLLSFKGLDTVNLLTLEGRIRVHIVFGEYAKLKQDRIRGQADMIYKNGEFYLMLAVEYPDNTPIDTEGFIGVDLGIKNIAYTSEGKCFSGESVNKSREKNQRLKSELQSKGTRSAKRKLKKLSGRERRFKRNVNHVISKEVVTHAERHRKAIVLEDLKHIRRRKTVKKMRKKNREQLGKWAFDELRQFIEYKAKLKGVEVVFVNPAYTSQSCSRCGHVSSKNRKTRDHFKCVECGFEMDADYNAAINIAERGRVNDPNVILSHMGERYKLSSLGGSS